MSSSSNNNSKANDVKIKVVFGKDIRRWHCSNEKNRYGELAAFVEKTFQLKNNGHEFQIQYEDLEMDRITLSNEQDFDDALNCALEQDRKSLKLYVVKPNREQDLKEKKVQGQQQKMETSAKTEEKKSENVNETSSSSCQQKNDKDNWEKMALDFLLNENVKKLLPELAGDVVKILRENNNNTGALAEMVQVVLSEDKYAPIVSHEFYQNQLQHQLPIWAARVAPFSSMLVGFNEESMRKIVANAINSFTISLSSGASCQGNNPMWNPMSFLCGGGLQQGPGLAGWGSSAWCGTGPEEVIHAHVQCDECKVQPIRGPRYKCTVCPNYDLCSRCEEAKKHDPNHPLLKMDRSDRSGGYMNFADIINQCSNLGGQNSRECSRKNKRCEPKASCVKEENNEPIYGAVTTVATKIWEVKNIGDEEWAENVELVFIKGNETLALEKRYTVPNTKPGEKIKLTAAIQIPSVSGRYSACFRLHKNGQGFGPRLWVDVFALADNESPEDEKKENKPVVEEKKPVVEEKKPVIEEKKPVIEEKKSEASKVEKKVENEPEENKIVVKCTCGEAMIETSPMVAYYEGAEVNCDSCGEACTNGLIYHCYSESAKHPKGYDICLDCAYTQESFEAQPEVVIQKKEEPIQPKTEKTTQVKEVQQPNPVVSDPLIGFQHEQQAREIISMGFTDVQAIKELLIRKKGNINEALAELLE